MVPAKETAEEQLLHMIEGPSGPRRPSGQAPKRLSMGGLLGSVSEWMGGVWLRLQPRKARTDAFLARLQLINRVVLLVLLGLGAYLVVELIGMRDKAPHLTLPPVTDVGQGMKDPGLTGEVGDMRPLAEYQQALKQNDPFRLESAQVVALPTAAREPENILEQKVAALTVVGMSRGSIPEALVEDTELRRTHFVTVGKTINGLLVEAIDDQGVLVSYDNESMYIP